MDFDQFQKLLTPLLAIGAGIFVIVSPKEDIKRIKKTGIVLIVCGSLSLVYRVYKFFNHTL